MRVRKSEEKQKLRREKGSEKRERKCERK